MQRILPAVLLCAVVALSACSKDSLVSRRPFRAFGGSAGRSQRHDG